MRTLGPLRPDLLDWQWRAYPNAHRDRINLFLHLATVPLFWLGAALPIIAVIAAKPLLAAGLPTLWLAGLVAQARGHRREATAAQPFLGPGDFVARLLAEQFVTFPRYLLSGGVLRALRSQRVGG